MLDLQIDLVDPHITRASQGPRAVRLFVGTPPRPPRSEARAGETRAESPLVASTLRGGAGFGHYESDSPPVFVRLIA